jgi:hypothetical protein
MNTEQVWDAFRHVGATGACLAENGCQIRISL